MNTAPFSFHSVKWLLSAIPSMLLHAPFAGGFQDYRTVLNIYKGGNRFLVSDPLAAVTNSNAKRPYVLDISKPTHRKLYYELPTPFLRPVICSL